MAEVLAIPAGRATRSSTRARTGLGHSAGIPIAFNALAAFNREREYSAGLERTLSKALTLLRMECSRREGRGEDVGHIRAFIVEASK